MTDSIKTLKAELAEIEKTLKSLSNAQSVFAQKTRAEAMARKAELKAMLSGSGAIAQGEGARAVGKQGVMVEGGVGGDVVTGVKVVLGAEKKTLPLPEALGRYLDNIIATHQHLRLQGIRAGSQLLNVALEKVYVSLTAVDKRAGGARAEKAPEKDQGFHGDSGILTISAAMQRYKRLVIIGDP